mmetsp:Transcript_9284/g.13806  ORF Transcript_9284/g.13806 Transcript_9284/m.13806 type:complete len:278 (-) Transcript_9284:27-860(-)|eukprot:CAMPEP_0202434392 /NCGR_PEP_ID=MMETSP1345-20130828/15239_1 /ASSEMBLY_ACC=CAM_ASM_000843 /TAXON_ID=342563 /ORGANISM="Fabrea Fabrea salina" /LENGTH=277 /DNA_ID=CAMNT_0049047063 /DNA_START=2123 /DNA_END=2956 /DNA_ORIENTATION=+
MDKVSEVIVHPLVLLSVVDHFNRVAKDTNKRVVGLLLGEAWKGRLDISNSFALPFEEDPQDSKVWFIDHGYLERMFHMFKRINAREKIVGWYSTGPGVKAPDIQINETMRKYTSNPILVVIDVSSAESLELPAQAYYAKEDVNEEGSIVKNFAHLPTILGASEAEEVGVEHLLRDVRDVAATNLATQTQNKIAALKAMLSRLQVIQDYIQEVLNGAKPNHEILFKLQEVFNLIPNTNVLNQAFAVDQNDSYLTLYLASVTRSVLALHSLINNKTQSA